MTRKEIEQTKWLEHVELLKEFIKEFGRFPKSNESYKDFKLGIWFKDQKTNHKSGKLSEDRKKYLDDNCPNWNCSKKDTCYNNWLNKAQLLKEFIKEFGRLPNEKEKYKNVNIGTWLQYQKINHKNGKLSEDRKKYLDDNCPNWGKSTRKGTNKQQKNIDKSNAQKPIIESNSNDDLKYQNSNKFTSNGIENYEEHTEDNFEIDNHFKNTRLLKKATLPTDDIIPGELFKPRYDYNYFVAFIYVKDGIHGTGNCFVRTNVTLDNIDALNQVTKLIEQKENVESVVIINYIKHLNPDK